MATAPTQDAVLQMVEAECARLDKAQWTLHFCLNIRHTIVLASMLNMSLHLPETNTGPSSHVNRAMLEFIIDHLTASPLLQDLIRQHSANPSTGGSHVPN